MNLCEPESIPLTNAAFRQWMDFAGFELERLDMKHYDVLTDYFINGNGDRHSIHSMGLSYLQRPRFRDPGTYSLGPKKEPARW